MQTTSMAVNVGSLADAQARFYIGAWPCPPYISYIRVNKSSAVAEMGDRGHNRHGPKRGGAAMPLSRKLGPRLIQCGLDQGPSPCQVPSWSMASRRFATIDMGRKLGAPPPFLGRGLGPHLSRSIYLDTYIKHAVSRIFVTQDLRCRRFCV